MSLWTKLFRPHRQHPSATARQKALVDGKVSQEDCIRMALHDSSLAVRERAVQQIGAIDVLVELHDQEPSLGGFVIARLRQLLPEFPPQSELAPGRLERAVELLGDAATYQALAESAMATDVRIAALRYIDEPSVLQSCVLQDKSGDVRKTALNRMQSEACVVEIVKRCKGRDKRVARQAEQRLADIRQGIRRQTMRGELLTRLEALHNGTQPLDERTGQRALEEWSELGREATDAERTRFDELLDGLSRRLEQQKRRQNTDQAARAERIGLIDRLTQVRDAVAAGELDPASAAITQLRALWAKATPLQTSWTDRQLNDQWTDLLHDLAGRLGQHQRLAAETQKISAFTAEIEARLQAGDLTQQQIASAELDLEQLGASEAPDAGHADTIRCARQLVDQMRQQYADQEARRSAARNALEAQIVALEDALAQKSVKRASKAHRAAVAALQELGKHPPSAVQGLANRLRRCEPELRELHAWRDWGNDHAREELVDAARELIDADLDLKARAQTLKDLRRRWKALRGTGHQAQKLWEAFDAACTAAHAPIQQQRAQEAEMRAENLVQRQAICSALEALARQTDWQNPDWRAVDKELQTLRRRWRDTGGVAQKAWGEVRDRYHRAQQALDQHLLNERRNNFRERQSLVAAAGALADQEDTRQAVAEARRLRDAWHVTVTSKPGEERRLWQDFNTAIDQVFARDRAAREDFVADLQEHRRQAEALCSQLEQLPSLEPIDLAQLQTQLAQAEAQFAALGALPKDAQHSLRQRFHKAVDQVRRHLEDAERRLSDLALQQLAHLHTVCEDIEALSQGDLAYATERIEDLRARWEAAPQPQRYGSVAERLVQRFETALTRIQEQQEVQPGDLEQNALAREALCLDLEILQGVASPADTATQRRQRQVVLLEQAMQGQDKDKAWQIRQLQLEYLATGAVAADRQDALRARFSQVFP